MTASSVLSTAEPRFLDVHFVWVYPDEDGDRVDARLNLDTGVLELLAEVPADIRCESLVRTRIEGREDLEDELVDAFFDRMGKCWRVRPCELGAFRDA